LHSCDLHRLVFQGMFSRQPQPIIVLIMRDAATLGRFRGRAVAGRGRRP
jgi:hypothetical protein